MAFTNAPFPGKDVIVGPNKLITQPWLDWFTQLTADVSATPSRLGTPLSVTQRTASIGSTSVNLGSLSSGLYRASYFARITTPASTSSSLTVGIGATDDAVTYTLTGTPITGNTPASVGSETWLLKVDSGTSIVYETTYVSVGAVAMVYSLSVVVERVQA